MLYVIVDTYCGNMDIYKAGLPRYLTKPQR